MSIYNSGNKVGNVLGITKMNTTVDKVYNETQIKNIETIKNNDRIIYFEKDSSYDLSNLSNSDTIVFDNNKKTLSATTDVNTSTNIITIANHGFYNDEIVTYTMIGSSKIGGLTDGSSYFIVNKETNTFQLSLQNGGDHISFTSQPQGLDTFHRSVTKKSATVNNFPNPPYV